MVASNLCRGLRSQESHERGPNWGPLEFRNEPHGKAEGQPRPKGCMLSE